MSVLFIQLLFQELNLLSFLFSQEVGLQELETGYRLYHSIRQVLCVMTLLGYHLIVMYVLSHAEGDLQICEEILRSQLQVCSSVCFVVI
jgi:hypothetical protein